MIELGIDKDKLLAAIQPDIANDASLRASAGIDELATAILALDGVQECDLAVALVRADARRTDAFCVTLGEALDPAQSATPAQSADKQPTADTSLRIIAEIVESLLMLAPAERGTVAKELAEADAAQADEFAVQLLASVDAVEDSRYVRMWKRIIASINADEHDYEAQIAGAQ